MTISQVDGLVRLLATVLGIIQAGGWIIMSLICIILYNGPVLTDLPTNYMEGVGYTIYLTVLSSAKLFEEQTFTAETFTGFMWIYFFLDIAWLIMSITIMRRNTSKTHLIWGVLTLVICFWDFLTFVIAGADYDKCLDVAKTNYFSQQFCANSFLVICIIAAKGFVLWIMNILLGVAVLKIGLKLKKEGS